MGGDSKVPKPNVKGMFDKKDLFVGQGMTFDF